jgi:hypothetical protein
VAAATHRRCRSPRNPEEGAPSSNTRVPVENTAGCAMGTCFGERVAAGGKKSVCDAEWTVLVVNICLQINRLSALDIGKAISTKMSLTRLSTALSLLVGGNTQCLCDYTEKNCWENVDQVLFRRCMLCSSCGSK